MTRPSHIRASKRAHGTCRNRRRPQGSRRPAWVRTFRRVHRAIESSVRLIDTTLRMVAALERCAHERPIHTSRNLDAASGRLIQASELRAVRAEKDLESSASKRAASSGALK